MRVTRFGRWLERTFSGHVSFRVPLLGWKVTQYGFNAMHCALNIKTRRWGYICVHPPVRCFGVWWAWKVYLSQCATPWAAYRGWGPGLDAEDRKQIETRRRENRCTCRGSREPGTVCERCGYPVTLAREEVFA